jgi:hypothetical protein
LRIVTTSWRGGSGQRGTVQHGAGGVGGAAVPVRAPRPVFTARQVGRVVVGDVRVIRDLPQRRQRVVQQRQPDERVAR